MSRKVSLSQILLATLAGTGAAQAANSTVELQLDADPLLQLALGRARQQAPCPEPLGVADTWLDHVEFPGEPFLQLSANTQVIDLGNGSTVNGRRAQIVLPTIVETKTAACIDTVGCDGQQMSFDVMLGLRVETGEGGAPELCAAVEDVSLPAPLHDPVLAKLQALVPETCVPIDIPIPTEELGLTFSGAAVSTNGQRLAVRVAFGGAGTGDFGPFLNGTLGPGTADGFSLFLDRHLFMDSLQNRAETALEALPDELSLRSGPTASYLPLNPYSGHPMVGLGIGLDLPICSIDVDANLFADFSLDGDDLVMEVNSHVNVDDVALGFCAAGLALVGAPFVPGLEFLIAAGAAVAVDTIEGLGVGLVPIPGCQGVDEDTQICRFGVALPSINLGGAGSGTLNLQSLTGHPQGLMLAGTFTAPPAMYQTPGTATADDVAYGMSGSCNGGFSSGYMGRASVSAFGRKVCPGVQKGSDPKAVYTLTAPAVGSATPAYYGVTFNEAAADASGFWASPYPLTVKMVTTAGVFKVQLAAPVKATDTQKLITQMKALAARVVCDYQLANPGPRPGWFDPRWHVDPPYDYPVNLVNSLGQTIRGRATIVNVRLASDSRTGSLSDFSLRTVGTMRADLVVGYTVGTRRYTFTAPVSFAVDQTMYGTRLGGGLTGLTLSSRLAPTVSIPLASLPTGMRSGSAALSISPDAARFEGVMR